MANTINQPQTLNKLSTIQEDAAHYPHSYSASQIQNMLRQSAVLNSLDLPYTPKIQPDDASEMQNTSSTNQLETIEPATQQMTTAARSQAKPIRGHRRNRSELTPKEAISIPTIPKKEFIDILVEKLRKQTAVIQNQAVAIRKQTQGRQLQPIQVGAMLVKYNNIFQEKVNRLSSQVLQVVSSKGSNSWLRASWFSILTQYTPLELDQAFAKAFANRNLTGTLQRHFNNINAVSSGLHSTGEPGTIALGLLSRNGSQYLELPGEESFEKLTELLLISPDTPSSEAEKIRDALYNSHKEGSIDLIKKLHTVLGLNTVFVKQDGAVESNIQSMQSNDSVDALQTEMPWIHVDCSSGQDASIKFNLLLKKENVKDVSLSPSQLNAGSLQLVHSRRIQEVAKPKLMLFLSSGGLDSVQGTQAFYAVSEQGKIKQAVRINETEEQTDEPSYFEIPRKLNTLILNAAGVQNQHPVDLVLTKRQDVKLDFNKNGHLLSKAYQLAFTDMFIPNPFAKERHTLKMSDKEYDYKGKRQSNVLNMSDVDFAQSVKNGFYAFELDLKDKPLNDFIARMDSFAGKPISVSQLKELKSLVREHSIHSFLWHDLNKELGQLANAVSANTGNNSLNEDFMYSLLDAYRDMKQQGISGYDQLPVHDFEMKLKSFPFFKIMLNDLQEDSKDTTDWLKNLKDAFINIESYDAHHDRQSIMGFDEYVEHTIKDIALLQDIKTQPLQLLTTPAQQEPGNQVVRIGQVQNALSLVGRHNNVHEVSSAMAQIHKQFSSLASYAVNDLVVMDFKARFAVAAIINNAHEKARNYDSSSWTPDKRAKLEQQFLQQESAISVKLSTRNLFKYGSTSLEGYVESFKAFSNAGNESIFKYIQAMSSNFDKNVSLVDRKVLSSFNEIKTLTFSGEQDLSRHFAVDPFKNVTGRNHVVEDFARNTVKEIAEKFEAYFDKDKDKDKGRTESNSVVEFKKSIKPIIDSKLKDFLDAYSSDADANSSELNNADATEYLNGFIDDLKTNLEAIAGIFLQNVSGDSNTDPQVMASIAEIMKEIGKALQMPQAHYFESFVTSALQRMYMSAVLQQHYEQMPENMRTILQPYILSMFALTSDQYPRIKPEPQYIYKGKTAELEKDYKRLSAILQANPYIEPPQNKVKQFVNWLVPEKNAQHHPVALTLGKNSVHEATLDTNTLKKVDFTATSGEQDNLLEQIAVHNRSVLVDGLYPTDHTDGAYNVYQHNLTKA